MKQGRTLQDLAIELERQRATRRDLVAPTTKLHMHTNGQSYLNVEMGDKDENYAVNEYDTATGFERMGGEILELPRNAWERISEARM